MGTRQGKKSGSPEENDRKIGVLPSRLALYATFLLHMLRASVLSDKRTSSQLVCITLGRFSSIPISQTVEAQRKWRHREVNTARKW